VAVPGIYYQKEKKITAKEEIALAYQIGEHLSLDTSKLHIRNLKEFYLIQYPKKGTEKITEEEYQKLKRRELSSKEIEELKISRITEEELSIYQEEDLKAAYLYYLMNHGDSYQEKILKNEGVTDEEYSYFSENAFSFRGVDTKVTWQRKYLYGDTFRSVLGNIGPVTKENKQTYLSLGYQLTDRVGTSNLELQYEHLLKGTKAKYLKGSDSNLEKVSDAIRGNDIVLTIDIELQKKVDELIDQELIRAKGEANTKYFDKTYAVIQQPGTGEILAISGRKLVATENGYQGTDITPYALTDPMAPGSVVKGASMLVGYNTGVLKIGEVMTDECIKIKSIPAKCSSHQVGRLNDIIALAESSNVYQFKIAMRVGGANYSYNADISINPEAFTTYRNTFSQFGLGVKTGIDLPVESLGYIGNSQKPEFLLNYAIGQYDTYTPIQLSQYITTIASNGNRYQPHLLKAVYEPTEVEELGALAYEVMPVLQNKVDTKEEYLKRVQEGFRAVMT
ncbi:MAG: penicillin-binding protein, partial [Bacilli bacterium]|nr:penicillin-binding protein [Bacilli bacterium]